MPPNVNAARQNLAPGTPGRRGTPSPHQPRRSQGTYLLIKLMNLHYWVTGPGLQTRIWSDPLGINKLKLMTP